MPLTTSTLYERYGGFSAIHRVILDFYDAVLDSDEVGFFFEHVDLKRIIDHQTKFISHLLGGPDPYSGDRLRAVHAPLGITDAHFDEVKMILSDVLEDHGFSAEDNCIVLEAIESRRWLIVAPERRESIRPSAHLEERP